MSQKSDRPGQSHKTMPRGEDQVWCPTREKWLAASAALWPDMPEADRNAMFDLLTGPEEAFMDAMHSWAASRGREVAGDPISDHGDDEARAARGR